MANDVISAAESWTPNETEQRLRQWAVRTSASLDPAINWTAVSHALHSFLGPTESWSLEAMVHNLEIASSMGALDQARVIVKAMDPDQEPGTYNQEKMRQVAVHETGHLVAMLLVAANHPCCIVLGRLAPHPGQWPLPSGRVSFGHGQPWQSSIDGGFTIFLAGEVAERIVLDAEPFAGPWETNDRELIANDWRRFVASAPKAPSEIPASIIEHCLDLARWMIEPNKLAILHIADQLVARRELVGEELDSVVAQAGLAIPSSGHRRLHSFAIDDGDGTVTLDFDDPDQSSEER